MDRLIIDPIDKDRNRFHKNSALKEKLEMAFEDHRTFEYNDNIYHVRSIETTDGWNGTFFNFKIMNEKTREIKNIEFELRIIPKSKLIGEILMLREKIKYLEENLEILKKEEINER